MHIIPIAKTVMEPSNSSFSFIFESFLDANGTVITDMSIKVTTVKAMFVLKPLLCRIQEAISKVMFQLVVLFAGKN